MSIQKSLTVSDYIKRSIEFISKDVNEAFTKSNNISL